MYFIRYLVNIFTGLILHCILYFIGRNESIPIQSVGHQLFHEENYSKFITALGKYRLIQFLL